MSRERPPSPPVDRNARDARLKAALKANMSRRKAQAKARAGGPFEANEADRDPHEQRG